MDSSELYNRFHLCKEMLETPRVMREFETESVTPFVKKMEGSEKIFFTGEGSSRIFPARRALYDALQAGDDLALYTEGAAQAGEYQLDMFTVWGASNSGRTKELVSLFQKLKESGHKKLFGLTANCNTPLEEISDLTYVLKCGKEEAVAATKSVVEQALFFQALMGEMRGAPLSGLSEASYLMESVLNAKLDSEIINRVGAANTIYFAGRHNGVAEELTLKTNEIVRCRSDYLEGTYLLHGVEEVIGNSDIIVIIDPFKSEIETIKKNFVEKLGIFVVAIADFETPFHTITVPPSPLFAPYIQLAAGWNLLVEAGLKNGVNIDKPERARKVGNEV